MSKALRLTMGKVVWKGTSTQRELVREACRHHTEIDDDGRPVNMVTEQHHKIECDVNQIIRKYDNTGLITHVVDMEGKYGDMTGVDYKDAMDLITGVQSQFNELPSNIRKEFSNSPQRYLAFMENPA